MLSAVWKGGREKQMTDDTKRVRVKALERESVCVWV